MTLGQSWEEASANDILLAIKEEVHRQLNRTRGKGSFRAIIGMDLYRKLVEKGVDMSKWDVHICSQGAEQDQ